MRANKAADCTVCNASKIEKIVATSLSFYSSSLFIFLYFALSPSRRAKAFVSAGRGYWQSGYCNADESKISLAKPRGESALGGIVGRTVTLITLLLMVTSADDDSDDRAYRSE